MIEDEEMLLGQIFANNSVFYTIGLTDKDFESPKCRMLFTTMQHVVEKGLEIDLVTCKRENEHIDSSWMAELTDRIGSTANYAYYENRIRNSSNLRRLNLLSLTISDSLKEGKTAEQVKEIIETELTNISIGHLGYEIKPITPVLLEVMDSLEERYKLKGKLPGITTGFSRLDDILLGLKDRLLYLFAARPSRGKTALMLNMLYAASKDHKVGVINTESANQEMGQRLLSSVSNLDSQRIASGAMMQTDFARLTNAAGILSQRGIYFYDEPNASLSTVIAKCREMVRRDKVECIFIDYIQNVGYNEKPTERENLGVISTRLKSLARDLNIPVVAMAQLRRESDGAYKRPTMSELLGSGKLEQDADVIGLIWWQLTNTDEHKHGEEPEFNEWLLIDKNRDGMTGSLRMKFNRQTVKFVEIERESY